MEIIKEVFSDGLKLPYNCEYIKVPGIVRALENEDILKQKGIPTAHHCPLAVTLARVNLITYLLVDRTRTGSKREGTARMMPLIKKLRVKVMCGVLSYALG
jgi:hypothetical protein